MPGLHKKKSWICLYIKKKLGKNLSALKPVMRLRYSDVVIILTSMPSRSLVFVERSPQNCKRKAFSENQLRSCLAALDTNKQFLLIILNFVVAVLPSFLHEHSHSHNLLLNKLECWLWIVFFCLFLCKLILTRFAWFLPSHSLLLCLFVGEKENLRLVKIDFDMNHTDFGDFGQSPEGNQRQVQNEC